jgi:ABC-type Fe3+ transport system permease subunit
VVNSALIWVGLIDQPLEFLLYNTFAVVLTLAHAWAAFAILPIYVSLQKIDRSLIEAAQDLGESPARTFLRVTLPLSLPGVIAALLLVFIPTVMWSMYLLYRGLPVVLRISPERGMLMASALIGYLLVAAVSLLGLTVALWGSGIGPSIGV